MDRSVKATSIRDLRPGDRFTLVFGGTVHTVKFNYPARARGYRVIGLVDTNVGDSTMGQYSAHGTTGVLVIR